VQSDVDDLRDKIDTKKTQMDRDKAEYAAEDAEENATMAVYFALDAIDYAETAAIDAAIARDTANAF
jgi:hypothetical protein